MFEHYDPNSDFECNCQVIYHISELRTDNPIADEIDIHFRFRLKEEGKKELLAQLIELLSSNKLPKLNIASAIGILINFDKKELGILASKLNSNSAAVLEKLFDIDIEE